jgi:hypothetical protein
MTCYTHDSNMVSPHYVCAGDPSYNPSDWRTYCTHCSYMVSPRYVYVDDDSNDPYDWMIYNTHGRNTCAPHLLQVPVHSEYSAKREEITRKVLLWREMSLTPKYSMRLKGNAWGGGGERESVCVCVCVCERKKVQLQFHYVTILEVKGVWLIMDKKR